MREDYEAACGMTVRRRGLRRAMTERFCIGMTMRRFSLLCLQSPPSLRASVASEAIHYPFPGWMTSNRIICAGRCFLFFLFAFGFFHRVFAHETSFAGGARREVELELRRLGLDVKERVEQTVRLCGTEALDEFRLSAGEHLHDVVLADLFAEQHLRKPETDFRMFAGALGHIPCERLVNGRLVHGRNADLVADFLVLGIIVIEYKLNFVFVVQNEAG